MTSRSRDEDRARRPIAVRSSGVEPERAAPEAVAAPVRAPEAGRRLGTATLLRLQRSAGNRAVQRLVRPERRRPDATPGPDRTEPAGPAHEDAAPPVEARADHGAGQALAGTAPTPPSAPGGDGGGAGTGHAGTAPHAHAHAGHGAEHVPPRPVPASQVRPAPKPGGGAGGGEAAGPGPAPAPVAAPAPVLEAPAGAGGGAPAPPALDEGGGGGDGGGAAAEAAPGTSDGELGELDSSLAGPAPAPPAEAEAAPEPEPAGAEGPTPASAQDGDLPSGGMPAAGALGEEPVPDAGTAVAAAQVDEEQEAEAETREEESAEGPEPAPVEAPAAEAGVGAEGPDASEADVSTAANAEVDAGIAEGGDDDAGAGAGGGGGGGGGGAIPEKDEPAPPDVAGLSPEAGLGQAASLPPAQLLTTLGGVSAAAQREAGEARSALAADPPTRARSAGSPSVVPGPASDRIPPPPGGGPSGATALPAGADRSLPKPPDPKVPTAPPPAPPTPQVATTPEGSMGAEGGQEIRSAINRLPAHDPEVRIPADPAPRVRLDGAADPAAVDAQAAEGEASVTTAAGHASADAVQPMGEDELYPTVPPETLRADVSAGGDDGGGAGGGDGGAGGGAGGGTVVGADGGGAGGGGAGAEGGTTEDEAASIIAHQEHGPEIQGAVAQGTGLMATARSDRARAEGDERRRGEEEMTRLEQENAAEQADERNQARAEVSGKRAEWRAQQAEVVGTARTQAGQARAQAHADVASEQARGDAEAAQHHAEGQREATDAQRKGEEEAAHEREKGKKESSGGGFFGWLASKATALFDAVKKGVQAAFAAARAAVKAALAKATELAHAAIEKARQAAVALVRAAGSVLVGIASVALAAFPRLRDAAVGFIRNRVKAAEAAVNKLAEKLKAGVTAALNLLGKALNGILDIAEKALLAAVSVVGAVVRGIINKVKAAIQMLGTFAVLIRDIAAGPAQWLRNLGAALMDGVRNHLWKAFKTAVKSWFNDKVEQVVGVGKAVWNLLVKGGLTLAKIGSMVWEGIKAAIPPALIALLIEKLVSLLVPAAAAVMLIIQGLQAAWGAASRMLQAFERFFAFLRAVRRGNAGPQFAELVAAAATVVLDFLANFLIARLAKGASKVGQKLRSIAQRIGQRLKAVMSKVGAKLKGIGKKIADKVRGVRDRIRDRLRRGKSGKPDKKGKDKHPDDQAKKQARLDTAVAAIRPPVVGLLHRGASSLRLKAQLAWYRLRYRLSALTVSGGHTPQITAVVNPSQVVADGVRKAGGSLHEILNEVGRQLMNDAVVRGEVERIRAARAAGAGTEQSPRESQSMAGEAAALSGGAPRAAGVKEHIEGAPGVVVKEKQTYSSAPGHVKTYGTGGGGDYAPGIQRGLADLRASGMSDADIRVAMESVMRGETPVHAAFEGGKKGLVRQRRVVALTRLMMAVEPGRHPAAMATSFMGISMLGRGDLPASEVITELNPMAPKRATTHAGYSRIDPELRAPAQVRDLGVHLEREVKMAIAYIEMLVKTEGLLFATDDDVVTWIRTHLRDRLVHQLRQAMWPAGAGAGEAP